MDNPTAKVAVVTGASRGVGRGIAEELAAAGFEVFVTGRTVEQSYANAPTNLRPLRCDHTNDNEVAAVFKQVISESGRIDLLVNNVWGGSENLIENGEFTWGLPFWKQRADRWDSMFAAGVRAHYIATSHVAPIMVQQMTGLVINLSYWAAQKFMGNVAYGVAKAATDKMTSDMSHELSEHNVTVVSLYPGLVRTEKVMELAEHVDLSNSESPRYVGRAVLALAADEQVLKKTGGIYTTAHLGQEYGFCDIDGKQPVPLSLQDL